MRCTSLVGRVVARFVSPACLLVAATPAFAVTTFNDGGIHDVSAAIDQLEILDGPASAPTTVNVQAGAVVGAGQTAFSVNVRDNSVFNMSGGSLFDELFLFNNSSAHLTGGSIGDDLTPDNNATVTVTSVTVNDDVEGHGTSTMTINGGSFDEDVESLDSAVITINGGTFQTGTDAANVLASGTSVINIHGGTFGSGTTTGTGGINAVDNAVINIFGGDIDGQTAGLNASGNGVINIFGLASQPASMTTTGNGKIYVYGGLTNLTANGSGSYELAGGGSQLQSILVNGTSTLIVRGSSFFVNGSPRAFGPLGFAAGTLSGTLADGSALSVNFAKGSIIPPAPIIILAPVPEPATFALAALALVALAPVRGRRGK